MTSGDIYLEKCITGLVEYNLMQLYIGELETFAQGLYEESFNDYIIITTTVFVSESVCICKTF